MPIENREIKSGVFADLFGDDEKDGKKTFSPFTMQFMIRILSSKKLILNKRRFHRPFTKLFTTM